MMIMSLVLMSRPAWGAWIEIKLRTAVASLTSSRPAWGAWIEIHPNDFALYKLASRAPHGARGLKLVSRWLLNSYTPSRPARGAWIEISAPLSMLRHSTVAPRTGRVD